MTYTPVVPFSGYAGWKFLERTMEKQQAAFVASAQVQRDEDYFREKIGSITSAEELVSDRRLLKVALGAFGLDDDINNKYFIRKVLEDGTIEPDALANKLSNKAYYNMSAAFGFGLSTPNTGMSDFADDILSKYESRQFEIAVGDQDDSMRMVLNAQREFPEIAGSTSSQTTKWLKIIGSTPLATVVKTAFGLPSAFGSLDVDKQVEMLSAKSEAFLGTKDPTDFTGDTLEKLTKLYLVRSQMTSGNSMSGNSTALMLLQNTSRSTFSLLV
ncbi:DUF1217 domain-containing protein [Phaeovulum vinaykumarii]|uniref:Flagellar protein n=1 Tax=Phaeovulum vinaykumarii TaxID=407234 RepID=A0A1N7MBP0_9RHOB|nr:DUF1217 domain-containing protein [Phaeovulum vinaykumarii]SIS83524.1 Protein of unknown function [Phaeovulum vinaykumarii]SOC10164.1 uncharacterized protein DUF1217 [Phaeovulum vinaykumarii]